MTPAKYLESRGGINAQGYWADSFVEGYTGQPAAVQKKYILDNNLIKKVQVDPSGTWLGATSAAGTMARVDATAAKQAIQAGYATDAISIQKRLVELTKKANSGAPRDPSEPTTNREYIGALSLNEIEEYNYLKSIINEKIKSGPTVYGTNPAGPGTPTVDTFVNPETGIDSRTGRKVTPPKASKAKVAGSLVPTETFGPKADEFYEQLKGKATSGVPLTEEEKDFTDSYLIDRAGYLGGQRFQGKQLNAAQLAEEDFLRNLGYIGADGTGATTGATGVTGATGATVGATGATGSATGGVPAITQGDVDAAVRKALAEAEAKAAAEKRETKAAEDAAKLAVKVKASDKLNAMFAGYGLDTLAGFISRRILADVSEDMLMLELYDQPEYQLRFPGMKALRSKGKTITEAEYIRDEKAYAQTARFFDVPVGFYDSPDDFGKLIGNLVSPKEFQDRLQVGQDLARSMSPSARAQLQEFYNVGEGGITAYVLDADRALPLIQKQAKAAQFVGFGREKGFKLEGMTSAQAEQIAGTEAYAKLSEQQLQTALGQAAQLRQTQSRLTGIEGEVYNENEALKAVIESSPEALLASQQRAQREGARFGGSTGITGSSLRSTAAI
jgi:hypothetical protein